MNGKQRWLIAAFAALAACSAPDEAPPLAGAPIGGDFALTNAAGATVTNDDLKGKHRLVYFGYTYCPDVCPVDVERMARAYARIEAEAPALAARLTPVFISVDPARDTPAIVGAFTGAFHPAIVGLTGSRQAVDKAVAAYRVYAARAEDVGSGADDGAYLMNHSANIYLMDDEGAPVNVYDRATSAEAIAADVMRWMR